jgi:hypothetical protein
MIVRYRTRTVLAALALGLAACTGVLAAGPAKAVAPPSAPTAAPGQRFTPLKVTPASAVNQPEVASNKPVTASNCGSVRAGIAEAKKEGKRYVGCMQIGQGTASAAAPTPAVRPDISLTSTCAQAQQDGPNVWAFNRVEECVYPAQAAYTIYDTNFNVLGVSYFNIYQDIHLIPASNIFTEVDSITFVRGTTPLAQETGALTFTSACGSPKCTVTPASAPVSEPINLGQTLNFGFEYRDTPSTLAPDQFVNTYNLVFLFPGFIELGPFTYTSATAARCDNQLPGVSTAGCVFPEFSPTLELSLATYDTAAANVGVAQSVVAGAPGTPGNPLTRGDPAKVDSNRAAICGKFVPLASVTDDSCDEYPFASTMQSGGARGLTGSACIETIPLVGGGGLYGYTIVNGAVGSPCEIGHVTSSLNSKVGSVALGPFLKQSRVIVGDAYYVAVTP